MRTKLFILSALIMAVLVGISACGSTKGYQGDKLMVTDVARIHQGTHKLQLKNKKTSEMALLVRVDTLSVGNYVKGFPKYVDVKPGERAIEIRHFRQWKENAVAKGAALGAAGALGGLIGGAIVGSAMASNNPHTHYKLTFPVEQGKAYTIMPLTDPITEVPEFFVIESASNDTIRPLVIQLEKKK